MFLSKFCKSIGFQIIFYIKYKYFCIYNIYAPNRRKTKRLKGTKEIFFFNYKTPFYSCYGEQIARTLCFFKPIIRGQKSREQTLRHGQKEESSI